MRGGIDPRVNANQNSSKMTINTEQTLRYNHAKNEEGHVVTNQSPDWYEASSTQMVNDRG